MAFAAVQGQVPAVGWWLFAANLFWVVAYDTEYAMVDRDDDLRIGVRSSAILFGRADVAAVMICYGAYFVGLLMVGALARLDLPFYLGWLVGVAIAWYHYTLIRARDRERCLRAFRHNQWVGLAIFAGVVGAYAAG
jgi:4-hydroxybenzoate polyprenyltransferase